MIVRKIAVMLQIAGFAVILGPGLASDASALVYIILGMVLLTASVFLWVASRKHGKDPSSKATGTPGSPSKDNS